MNRPLRDLTRSPAEVAKCAALRLPPSPLDEPDSHRTGPAQAVVPTGEREVWSLPEFLWWGVSFSERSGVDAEALERTWGNLRAMCRMWMLCVSRVEILARGRSRVLRKRLAFLEESVMEAGGLQNRTIEP